MLKIFMISMLFHLCSFAATPARMVMEKIEVQKSGFIGSSSEMEMILIDAYNKQVKRHMKTVTKEDQNDSKDKSITEFTRPLDVKGTKLLTWSMPQESNKIWLYLPRFKRVKKINSSGQAGSFMGSEFSYEDIAGQQIDKYTYKLISENDDTWIIEAKPKDKSGYSKTITTYSKKYYAPLSTEYYDRKGDLLKVSNASDYEAFKVKDKTIYYPSKVEMKNVQTKKASIIEWKNRKIGITQSENKFKSHQLK